MMKPIFEYVFKKKHTEVREEFWWTNSTGSRKRVSALDDDHLVNLILYLKKKVEELRDFNLPILPMNGEPVDRWIEILDNELEYRGLKDEREIC